MADAEEAATKPAIVPSLDLSNLDGAGLLVLSLGMTVLIVGLVLSDEVLVARAKELEVQVVEVQMENESLQNQVRFRLTVRLKI